MSSRRHIPLETKLAATLLQLGHVEYDHAKAMTAAQICSLYAFDHYPIRAVDGGPDEPWNLVPRLIRAHRDKTAKIDQPAIAKDRAIARREEEFRRRLLAKDRGEPRSQSRWPKRKMQSGRRFTGRGAE